jgi:uncharacterized membrane protein YccC
VRLLGTLLRGLALVIAGMAVLLGVSMAIDPRSIEAGLVLLVLASALAGACWAIGSRLRRDAAAVEDWEE